MSFIAAYGQGSAQYGQRGAAARAPGRKLAHAAALCRKRTRRRGGDAARFYAAVPIVAAEEVTWRQQRLSGALKAPRRRKLAGPKFAACRPFRDAAAHLAVLETLRRSGHQPTQCT